MRVNVIGEGHLADTVRECSAPHFTLNQVNPDVLWVCYDTPVRDDTPDVGFVCDRVAEALEYTPTSTLVLISSQVPVGTCALLEARHPRYQFAVSPENVRKASPVTDFLRQHRIVIGARNHDPRLTELFDPFCPLHLWMSPESAEMVKHALNGWLAMCIVYANDIADICGSVGADVRDVFEGFRSDLRVNGPLEPGGPFRGGTLGRDVHVLTEHTRSPLIHGIRQSNKARL
jgi:UDPglucose 6-dehydrogenase